MVIRRSIYIIIFIAVLAIAAAFSVGGSSLEANAEEPVSINVTCEAVVKVENGVAIYDKARKYDDNYYRNIKVEFTVNAPYYRLDKNDEPGKVTATPVGGKVYFTPAISQTAVYNLTCYAFHDDTGVNAIGSCSTRVKYDRDEPVIADIPEMTDWVRGGKDYDIVVDWAQCTDMSGLFSLEYRIDYDGESADSKFVKVDLSTLGKSVITIDKNCVLTVICFDRAGNCSKKTVVYNQFDDIKPPIPTYVISPEPSDDAYASKYAIKVNYTEDEQSGLSSVQKYIINGVTEIYDGEIVLSSPKEYDIRLFATDKVGNVSESVSIHLPIGAFDCVPPLISKLTYTIDLKDPNYIASISFQAADMGQSGVKQAYTPTLKTFFSAIPGENITTYVLKCNLYRTESIEIEVTDYAGNTADAMLYINHFGNSVISDTMKSVADTYKTLDKDSFTEARWNEIDNAYNNLNTMLVISQTDYEQFIEEANAIKNLIESELDLVYQIESAPETVSTGIKFDAEKSDFPTSKNGTKISLILSKSETDAEKFIVKSGFAKGFADTFNLRIERDGESVVETLAKGLTVHMEMPFNYLDREYKLYDMTTEEEVAYEIVNNYLVFNIKKDSSMAMVISGAKQVTGNVDAPKTVTVFGNTYSLPIFLAIVLVPVAFAIVVIIVVIVIKKARG